MTDSPHPKIHEQVRSPSEIAFGKHFSDHMLLCHWDRETGWEKPRILPYGDLSLPPGAHALMYATEVHVRVKLLAINGEIMMYNLPSLVPCMAHFKFHAELRMGGPESQCHVSDV